VGDLDPRLWFLGPTSLPPNGISIDSVVFASFTGMPKQRVTGIQTTERATRVAKGRIMHAMRPNN